MVLSSATPPRSSRFPADRSAAIADPMTSELTNFLPRKGRISVFLHCEGMYAERTNEVKTLRTCCTAAVPSDSCAGATQAQLTSSVSKGRPNVTDHLRCSVRTVFGKRPSHADRSAVLPQLNASRDGTLNSISPLWTFSETAGRNSPPPVSYGPLGPATVCFTRRGDPVERRFPGPDSFGSRTEVLA